MMANKKIKNAVIPGSFDPITVGHLLLIERAAKLFDHVYVTAFRNAEKNSMFTDEEKLQMMRLATGHLDNVTVSVEDGLTAVFAAEHHACIVKGVRNGTDFDYEMGMAEISRAIDADVETIFIPARAAHMHISSSYVREMLRYDHDFKDAVPPAVYTYLKETFHK